MTFFCAAKPNVALLYLALLAGLLAAVGSWTDRNGLANRYLILPIMETAAHGLSLALGALLGLAATQFAQAVTSGKLLAALSLLALVDGLIVLMMVFVSGHIPRIGSRVRKLIGFGALVTIFIIWRTAVRSA